MPVKTTLFFRQDKYTWSEAHYYLGGSSISAAGDAAIGLAGLRAACLGKGAALAGVRLSEVPANRSVLDLDLTGVTTTGNWAADPTNLTAASDRAYSSLLVRLQGGIFSKNYYMAGIPDSVVQTPGTGNEGYVLTGAFLIPFDSFMAVLTNQIAGGPWGFRSRLLAGTQQASGLTTNALFPGEIGVTVPATLGVPVGGEVNLTGWRRINTRSPGLAGAWQVVGIIPPASGPGPWTYFLGQSGNVSPTNFLGLGSIAPLSYQYVAYTSFQPRDSTSRKRGGSYGQPRGRSRARR